MHLLNKKIYIIDDNRAVCDSLKFLFYSVLNIDVETYDTSTGFLDKFSSKWEGCLIVDYAMPALNGVELIKKLQERNNTMGIIVISGNSTPAMIKNAFTAGAQSFITKPFKIDDFLAQVRHILGNNVPEAS